MVVGCCIKGCSSEAYAGCGISFHNPPKNKDTLQKWLLATGFESLAKKFICSNHFKKEDYASGLFRRILKPDAVPSLLLKKYEPKLFQSSVDGDSENSESEAKKKCFAQKNNVESIHYFSEKDGKITHVFENKLRGTIIHSFQDIEEDKNSVHICNNEEVISDTDSIFDPPSLVKIKQQLQKEKEKNEICRDEIRKLKRQNSVLRKRNLKCKNLIKGIKEKYIRKSTDPDGRIVVEFLPKIN